jgi:alkylated DNA repair dioxygenase AlkB
MRSRAFPPADQLSLFGEDVRWPEGLSLVHDFISAEEEATLLKQLRDLALKPFEFRGYVGARLTCSFGWGYDFDAERAHPSEPIPGFLLGLRERAATLAGLDHATLTQALVTEYPPEAGIGWHRDKAVFGDVIGVSLLAGCALRFRLKTTEWRRATVNLPPRSVYVLRGPAREVWEHSISRVPERRYSITFRTVR